MRHKGLVAGHLEQNYDAVSLTRARAHARPPPVPPTFSQRTPLPLAANSDA